MALLFSTTIQTREDEGLKAMFVARKRVFIDLLHWDIPALDGKYEIDGFDDEHAHYLILTDRNGAHLASARLLPTTQPHILGMLFPELCEDGVPIGDTIFEITRFCLDRDLTAIERRTARNQLITALVEHALANGIERYTGVAGMAWLQQILGFGWDCRPLGAPVQHASGTIAGLDIHISRATPALLEAAGIWLPTATPMLHERRAVGANG
ncbi:MAG: acyl-homoserine-lactone synthase [Sphingomonas sp.]|jgi:acyl-homoserine lactone synthase|uniref:acyl-homoserine-lactone synthase n=1 Tax=Sphingomonas sp. TaxID=28214 RepID=UPI0035660084